MRTLELNTWTLSECISNGNHAEQRAYYWANRINDYQYHERFRMSSESCEYQLILAAESATWWYARAAKCKR